MVKNMNASKKIFWFVIFILLVIFTIYTMVSQSEDFSLQGFIEYTKEANKIWMVFAILCMLLFIYIEGMSIRYIAKFLGYRRSMNRGFLYSTANIYFSAITPSATGGQPASAFFMVRDGIPISVRSEERRVGKEC